MTTPQPSSPGATRAAGVLTAAGRLHHHQQQQHSFTPYASGDQHHLYHSASASASSTYSPYLPPPTSATSGAGGGGPSSHQSHYTTTTTAASQQQAPLQGFSPSLFENKIELPPATLPPPVNTSARRPSFQQPQPHPQEYYHRHHHQASIPPPIASTSAASASAVGASPPPAAPLKKESKASTTTNPVRAAAPAATLASTPSSSLKSETKVAENAKSGPSSSSSSSSRKRALSTSDPSTTAAATIPATTSGSATKKKPTRRYNASCDACRARKRKCPGRDPVTGQTLCTACADRGVECTYGNLGEPSRLRRADTENEKLRTIITNALQAETAEEKDDILATITERMLASSASGHHAGKSRRSSEAPEESAPGLAKRFKEEQDEDAASVASTTPAAATVTSQPESSHLKPSYLSHLSSHAMNGADSQHATGVPSPRPSSDEETSAQFTQAVISNEQERGQGDSELERHVSFYLSMALPHGDFQDAPSPTDDQRLLEFYFSWLNPRYALLSRKFFEQSRHLGDEVYCTPFLLWSLYAHSATHCPGFEKHQAYFRARAHILLTKELCKGKAATLPLAQGLILLAGTAAAKSDHSLAWTLSYTVTGMVIDLLETMDQSITENERIMRKRLYWSHYVWALVLALALNRKPCVPKLKVDLPDIGTDTDLWQAALPVRSIEEPPQTLAIPRPGHELECFKETCQLFSFLDEILSNVYVAAHDKRNPETINNAVRSIQERMTTWQNTKLSSNILLNAQDLPALCPPPHIIHFNLLLRAIWILLYRPFYNLGSRAKNPIKGARQSCNQCASEIYAIFLYLEQNFGVLQLHFSFIYSAYWAATIDVASAKRDGLNPDLLARLRNSSRILLTWISLPGMRQSVSDLIEQIEALLLADVPPQLPQTSEVFSAYDPLHQPQQPGQEMIVHNNNADAYYAQMGNMLRPQQDFMLSDPMLGVPPPLDYGPLGGLYWDSAAPPLW